LAYSAKALEFACVNQADEKSPFIIVRFEADYVVNRVAVDFFRQFISPQSFTMNFVMRA
jgi:hypothetical protein